MAPTSSLGSVWFAGLLWAAMALLTGGCTPKQGQEMKLPEWISGPDGPKLVAMAHDTEDADHRREGIALLSEKEWGRGEPYLAWYANRLEVDRDPGVRGVAARALAKAGAVKYLPTLVAAMSDRSPAVRLDVVVALERLRGEAAIDPLRRAAAEDGSPDVRAAAAKVLRHYPQAKVAGTLVYCLSDESFEVRHWAHESLVEMTGKDLGAEPGDWASVAGPNAPLRGPQWRRPWWDWFGTTKPQEPAAAAASQPAGKGKPWWDWMGVTGPTAGPPTPASAPAK